MICEKIFFLFVVLCLALLYNNNELNAQCSTGFTPVVKNMTIGGCPYQITFCVKCMVTGINESWITVTDIQPLNPLCNPSVDPDEYIESLLYTVGFWSTFCDGSIPCTEGVSTYNFIMPICWKIYKFPGMTSAYKYVACNLDQYCYSKFVSCTDQNGNKLPFTQVPGYPQKIGDPTCTDSEEDILDGTEPYNLPAGYKDCFYKITPCPFP